MENAKIKIAVVEDNEGDALLITEMIGSKEVLIDHFYDLESALNKFELTRYDAALVDLGLPGCVGAEAPMMIINEHPELPVIVLTGSDDPRVIKKVLSVGAQDYLIKGNFDKNTLIRSLRYSIERKKVSEQLYKQKYFAENVIDTAHAIVMVIDKDFKIISVNRFFENLSGYKQEEIKGKNWVDIFVPAEYKRKVFDVVINSFNDKPEQDYTNPIIIKNGKIVDIEWHCSLLKDKNNQNIGLLSIGQDITKRKLAEEQLRESAALLRKTQQIAHIGSWMFDYSNNKLIWSEEVYKIFGLEPNDITLNYETFLSFIVEDDRTAFDQAYKDAVNSGRPFEYFHRIKRKDGKIRTLYQKAEHEKNKAGKKIRTLGMVSDISEQKELEEQLRQSQKMEAIGLLAGGIAHDFNNLLMVILCNCDLMLARSKKDDPLIEDIVEIKKSGQRAAELTRQLLAFSRKQVLKPQIVDINMVVKDLEKMIGRLVGEKIELVTVLNPDLTTVLTDRGQLDQVIMNLVVNARDAMPKGGKITIETANIKLSNEYTRRYSDIKPGNYVMMAVTDTGTGMSKEIVDKIFEPFFTTKGIGKGTGLGLSTVYGIIKQSGGYIYCYSEPGIGTTFKIYLPYADDEIINDTPTKSPEELVSHGEKIVIIDDEKEIRDIVTRMLEQEGYEIFVAENYSDVMKFFRMHKIDLLITDVIMPELNGDELGMKILEDYPGTKIIYMSGYTESTIMDFSLLDKNKVYLQKPFTRQYLVKNVKEILNN
jgi:PAS domain S-box-containing protein